ncbi:MAG: SAM-dependent methyltransferase [Planctomycetota bacterium]
MSTVDAISIDRWKAGVGHLSVPGCWNDLQLAASQLAAKSIRLAEMDRKWFESQAELFTCFEPVPWYPELGFVLKFPEQLAGKALSRHLGFASGRYYLQDASSMLPLALLSKSESLTSAVRGKVICDLCASPGGKASAILEAIGSSGDGFLVANEVIRSRVTPLCHNLARTGCDRYVVTNRDPDDLAIQAAGCFDVVIVDVPCSGQGLIAGGRHNDSALDRDSIQHCAARGSRILGAASRLLRPGGTMIYSTCTFARDENEDQVERMIREQGMAFEEQASLLSWLSVIDDKPRGYRVWPHIDDCHGGFAAKLTKMAEMPTDNTSRPKRVFRSKEFSPPKELWLDSCQSKKSHRWHETSKSLHAIPSDAPEWVLDMSAIWPMVATRRGKIWHPHHEYALMQRDVSDQRRSIDLSDDEAVAFLAGEAIRKDSRDSKGYSVASWRGRPLGWVKVVDRLLKNHLPSYSRISNAWA